MGVVTPGILGVIAVAGVGVGRVIRGGTLSVSGMRSVGVGSPAILGQADLVIPGFIGMTVDRLPR